MAQTPTGPRIGTPGDGPTEIEQQTATGMVARMPMVRHDATDRAAVSSHDPLSIARRLCAERRMRDRMFGPLMLEGGTWDILLDVYIHAEQSMPVSISSACLGVGVSSTTALRRITEMEAADLLKRTPDPQDRRRSFLSLSDHAMASMRRYLSQMNHD